MSTRVVGFSPAEVKTKIVGASPKQEAVLREILAGIGPTSLASVEVEQNPEAGWSGGLPDAVGFRADSRESDSVAAWHADLIGYAFADRSEQLDLQPVVYVADRDTVTTTDVYRPDMDLSLEEALEFGASLREKVEQAGAKVRGLELLKPDRYAFRLELQVDDPADFLRNEYYEAVLAPFESRRVERYVEIRDANGEWVLTSGAGFGIRRDLDSCYPGATSFGRGLFDAAPPPCPAQKRND